MSFFDEFDKLTETNAWFFSLELGILFQIYKSEDGPRNFVSKRILNIEYQCVAKAQKIIKEERFKAMQVLLRVFIKFFTIFICSVLPSIIHEHTLGHVASFWKPG